MTSISPIALQDAQAETAEVIRVRGRVQGVGFRPTVYRLAQELNLRGEVQNDGQGVVIRLAGWPEAIADFVQQLTTSPPPLARIETLERQPIPVDEITVSNFRITHSVNTIVRTEISPDAATCPECRAEVFDPYSRRYRYPFTNCTHCGPRLSIVRGIPYDRSLTSMASFPLCPDCQQEYEEVSDRRFHAQPIACHRCGPHTWLERRDGKPIHASMFSMLDDVDAVCTLLQQGEIIAIKGMGGFHLACDATQEAAVQTLRQRKHRDHKPFALMARDLEVIERYCWVNHQERDLLESSAAPIVLLSRKAAQVQKGEIAHAVAPDRNTLGFMLPYTPLHHLILKRMDRPIVLTSGNLSDQPQCIDNNEAHQKLAGIADYFLFHNREIVNRVDDSVVRVVDDRPQIFRRARGYAPAPIRLPAGFEQAAPILAMGSELKNTFCLIREGQAILSQHLGDLENAAALEAYQQTLQLYANLFEHQPTAIAIDLHPEYLTSKLGVEMAIARSLPIYQIQHHHAHIAACMAENGLPLNTAPVLGIALDGLGYGEDNTLWGGEFLLADYAHSQRLAHFKPVAMLGGEQAIYQPWRNTYAHLIAAAEIRENSTGDLEAIWQGLQEAYADLELIKFLAQKPLKLLNQMLVKGINSPLASSCGRLFDAVAAAIGICRENCSYEGQGAIALETAATNYLNSAENWLNVRQNAYSLTLKVSDKLPILDSGSIWPSVLRDLNQEVEVGAIAARFHLGLAQAIVAMVNALQSNQPFTQIVLSGGVWQNGLLLQQVKEELTQQGFVVLTHQQVPTNDGGLALGQGAIAAARSIHLVN